VKIKYSNRKWHILGAKHVKKRRVVTIHPPARLVGEPQKKKKGRKKERHPNSGKLAIRPDHPRRRIEIKLYVVCGLRV